MRVRLCLALLGLAAAVWAGDQGTEERLKQLEDQNKEILDRLKQSEGKNTKLESEIDLLRARESEHLKQDVEHYLEATRALEGAPPAGTQTKCSSTGSCGLTRTTTPRASTA